MNTLTIRIVLCLALLLGLTVSGQVAGARQGDPLSQLDNLVCVPDPLVLTLEEPSGEIVFQYTGGASGLIYGYSIDVMWDTAVAAAGVTDFARPDDGAFSDTEFFLVQLIDDGHVRVDAAIGSLIPGIDQGPLFKATFTRAAGAFNGATTPIAIEVLDVRDHDNMPVIDLDPVDGVILVELPGPEIDAVLVTDTDLDSSEWTRDGNAYMVLATVTAIDIATLTCDLTNLGGPILELGDAVQDGELYTWTWAGPSVCDPPDGPVTVTVTCIDANGEVQADGLITADNTPPDALLAFAAEPGHQKIHLAWELPADDGSPIGVVLRYVTWGGYPQYEGLLPEAPADLGEGLAAGEAPLGGDGWTWAEPEWADEEDWEQHRDVHILAAFVVDLVGNVGAERLSAAATNYWLGDVDGDGEVTVVVDITALADNYGLQFDDDDYDGRCDVGPTMNYSPRGVPDPQQDGYRIQFEDLMVFALNWDEVAPDLKSLPNAAPYLHWEQVAPAVWALSLLEPCPGLKGLNLRADLPAGVTCQVEAGELLARQAAPVFLRNIPAGGLDAGLAVVGGGQTLTGAGEVARVVLSQPVAGLTVGISARDLANTELLVELAAPTGAVLPAAHALAQSYPNPFNPATTIDFALPRAEHVHLSVYTVEGRRICTLLDEPREAGRHTVVWAGVDDRGRRVATGTYFYALQAGDFRQVRKMTLVK